MTDNIEKVQQELQNIVLGLSDGKKFGALAEVSSQKGVTQLKVTQPSTGNINDKEKFRADGIIETYKLIDNLVEKGVIPPVFNNSSVNHALQNLAPEKPINIGEGVAVSVGKHDSIELSIKTVTPVKELIKKLQSSNSKESASPIVDNVNLFNRSKMEKEGHNPFV